MFKITQNNYNSENVSSKEYSTTDGISYQILNYNQEDNDTENGAYRSVVIDNKTKAVVCVAPPKSVTFDYFATCGQVAEIAGTLDFLHQGMVLLDSHVSGLVLSEIVEGTMVNLFYNETWEIASKGAVGGNYWYYRTNYDHVGHTHEQRTFREMFMDALGVDRGMKLNDVPLFNELPKNFIYSFVLQHPDNHIVMNLVEPRLYLVAAYCAGDDDAFHTILPSEIRKYSFNQSVNNVIWYPREVPASEWKYGMLMGTDHMFGVGYMLTDTMSGLRTAIQNPQYVAVKELRGNHPNLQYQYFELFQEGKIREFLNYFPRYNELFYKFHLQSMNFIQQIHDAYVSYHIKKRGAQVRINKSIFHHIYKLHHEVYLPSIESGGEPAIVTRKIASDYFNAMSPKEKLYHVNYKLRETDESK